MRLLNSIALRNPELILSQNALTTVLSVTNNNTPDDNIYQTAKFLKNLLLNDVTARRVVNSQNISTIVNVLHIALRSKLTDNIEYAQCAICNLIKLFGNDHTNTQLWSELLTLLTQEDGVLSTVMKYLSDAKQKIKTHVSSIALLTTMIEVMPESQVSVTCDICSVLLIYMLLHVVCIGYVKFVDECSYNQEAVVMFTITHCSFFIVYEQIEKYILNPYLAIQPILLLLQKLEPLSYTGVLKIRSVESLHCLAALCKKNFGGEK